MIRYGFACKVIGVPGAAQSGLTLARASRENLIEVGRNNLSALGLMLDYCAKEGLPVLRLSSDTIPLASHPKVKFDWKKLLFPELQELREKIKACGLRVSMHPGQYTVLNSPRPEVVENSVADLLYHAEFLEALGAGPSARIVLHLGGAYGHKRAALERLEDNLRALPQIILKRLALENDERIFNIEDVLGLTEKMRLPAIFDVFHHSLNSPAQGDLNYWLGRAAATWPEECGPPKIHYSQQLPGAKPGSHSRTIGLEEFELFRQFLGSRKLDVMLEVKDKNLSAVKCANLTAINLPRRKLTDEWARYKYLVLERSPDDYQRIRRLLKDPPESAARIFYGHVERALEKALEPGRALNAAQHVWGYLDRLATPGEAKSILAEMDKFASDIKAVSKVKRKLLSLAQAHQVGYLLNSLYFYL